MLYKKTTSFLVILSLIFLNITAPLYATPFPPGDKFSATASVPLLDCSQEDSSQDPLKTFLKGLEDQHLMGGLRELTDEELLNVRKNLDKSVFDFIERVDSMNSVDDLRPDILTALIEENLPLKGSLGFIHHRIHSHNSKTMNWVCLALGTLISLGSIGGITEVFSQDPGIAYLFQYMVDSSNASEYQRITVILSAMGVAIPELYEMTISLRSIANWFLESKENKNQEKVRAELKAQLLDLFVKGGAATLAIFKTIVQYQIISSAFDEDFNSYVPSAQPWQKWPAIIPFLYSQFVKYYTVPSEAGSELLHELPYMRGKTDLVRRMRHELRAGAAAASRAITKMEDQDFVTLLQVEQQTREKLEDPKYARTVELYRDFGTINEDFIRDYNYKGPHMSLTRSVLYRLYDPRHPLHYNIADILGKLIAGVGSVGEFFLLRDSYMQLMHEPNTYFDGYDPSATANAYGGILAFFVTSLGAMNLGDVFKRFDSHLTGYRPEENEEFIKEHARIGFRGFFNRVGSAAFLGDFLGVSESIYFSLPVMLQAIHVWRVLQAIETNGEYVDFSSHIPLGSFLEALQTGILFRAMGLCVREAIRKVHEWWLFDGFKNHQQRLDLSKHRKKDELLRFSQAVAGLTDEAVVSLWATFKKTGYILKSASRETNALEASGLLEPESFVVGKTHLFVGEEEAGETSGASSSNSSSSSGTDSPPSLDSPERSKNLGISQQKVRLLKADREDLMDMLVALSESGVNIDRDDILSEVCRLFQEERTDLSKVKSSPRGQKAFEEMVRIIDQIPSIDSDPTFFATLLKNYQKRMEEKGRWPMFGGKDQFATLTALVEKVLELDGAAVPEEDVETIMEELWVKRGNKHIVAQTEPSRLRRWAGKVGACASWIASKCRKTRKPKRDDKVYEMQSLLDVALGRFVAEVEEL